MKATVDADRCGGHGVCVGLCPDVFTLTDDGYAVARDDEIPVDFEEAVRAAMNQCPTGAITAD